MRPAGVAASGARQIRRIKLLGAAVACSLVLLAPGCAAPRSYDSEPLAGGDGGRNSGAEVDRDGGANDGGELGDVGLLSECQGDVLSFPAARVQGTAFRSGVAGNTVHLVYLEPACGGTRADNSVQSLAHVQFETSGSASEPELLVNACNITGDPALIVDPGGGYEVFFTSNLTDSYELFYVRGDGSQPVRQTEDDHYELASVAALFGLDQARVAYSKDQPLQAAQRPAAEIVTATPGGATSPVAAESEGFHAAKLVLTALGGEGTEDRAGVVAWLSNSDTRPGMFLRFLDASGSGIGEVVTLSNELKGTSNVALAGSMHGGAVVYTASAPGEPQEIRFRTLDTQGGVGDEVSLIRSNEQVRDVAIAAYSAGYIVTYRGVEGAVGEENSIQAMFVDKNGNLGRLRRIASATGGGNGLEVHVARDGRLLVVWVDTANVADPTSQNSELENRIMVARLLCP